jgi:hypothetical protein
MTRGRSTPRRKHRSQAGAAAGGPFDTFAYWLMPQGLRAFLTTIFWSSPGPVLRQMPFPLLAPGKTAALGEHAFWRGLRWGKTVALQGDSTFTKFDLFELSDSRLLYWGTFRGNGYYGSEESHSFTEPSVWLDRLMSVGDFKQQWVTDTVLDPQHRAVANSGGLTLRTELVAHHDAWRDPDSGVEYQDVLELFYWSRYPEPLSREVYHLGNGLGTIRFESMNPAEPNGVHIQYLDSFERFSPPEVPTLPWFDPFKNTTFVRNGFCEDFLIAPVQGGAVARYLRGWTGSKNAVITTNGGDEGNSPWKIALRGASGGGDGSADFAISSDWIPVRSGLRYRLSGSLWRVSAQDNVYLDFNDGVAQGDSFEDAQAMSQKTEVWERVSAEATVGPATTAIKVRCVRDGANRGNAYCDGITLQRVD